MLGAHLLRFSRAKADCIATQKCQLCTEMHGTKGKHTVKSGLLSSPRNHADHASRSRSVQCTKGKCAKSFHVTCALQEGSGIFLNATIPDAEHEGESVSILEQAKSSEAAATAAQPSGEAVASEQASTLAPATTTEGGPAEMKEDEQAVPAAAAAPPAASTEASNSFVHLTILCRTHNPVRRLGFPQISVALLLFDI